MYICAHTYFIYLHYKCICVCNIYIYVCMYHIYIDSVEWSKMANPTADMRISWVWNCDAESPPWGRHTWSTLPGSVPTELAATRCKTRDEPTTWGLGQQHGRTMGAKPTAIHYPHSGFHAGTEDVGYKTVWRFFASIWAGQTIPNLGQILSTCFCFPLPFL